MFSLLEASRAKMGGREPLPRPHLSPWPEMATAKSRGPAVCLGCPPATFPSTAQAEPFCSFPGACGSAPSLAPHWEKNRPGENKATDMARVPPCAPAEPLADQSPGPTPVLGGMAEPADQPTSPTLAPLSGTRDIPGARLTGKENHRHSETARHTDTSSHPRSRHSANICRAPTVCWPLGAAPIWKPHSQPLLLSEGGRRHTCSVTNEHFKC